MGEWIEEHAAHIAAAIAFGPIALGAISLIFLLRDAFRAGKPEKPETEAHKKMENAAEWVGKALIVAVEIAFTLLGIWGIYHFIKGF